MSATISDLFSKTPFYIAHRGSGDEAPEHTLEAYRYAVSVGAKALELSVQRTADGVLVCYHDTTLARMTGGVAGAVSDYTYAQLKNKIPVKGQDLLGPGWANLEIPLLSKVLEEFYGRVVLFIEPKTTDATAPLQKLLQDLPGATESVVYKSHVNASSGLAWAQSNGFRTWAYLDSTTTSAQMDAAEANVTYWGIPDVDPSSTTNAQIAAVRARPVVKPIIVWEVHRRSRRDELAALGVQGMMTSGYSYVTSSTPLLKDAHFELGVKPPGSLGIDNTVNQALRFDSGNGVYFTTAPNRSAVMGALCPLPANGYTIFFDMKWDTIPAASLHAGIAFGRTTDDIYRFGQTPTGDGYHVLIRDDGDLQLYTHTSGVGSGTSIGTANNGTPDPANPVAGVWMSYSVNVTTTGITVSRLDVPKTITVSDTTRRGGYFHLVGGNTTDVNAVAHFRNVKVTY
ncbi:glycerophosphodiester phosphodiesterase [Kribbella sindirgiensis]|uniref:Glycerophosphodiester phosphodiesterase n=1 Tax=Kribbella sindirgiensis TaxID=1124744 RepID=A0A4R0I669_9ACTN|nr:glycerophosphodiester phosphodiesterase family protein [Kribbella sindirgiensis]TCC19955.1 glycerophosphodiester phosphodiesterase [Kribbella sindirgiensis]